MDHAGYMDEAILLANRAAQEDEIPVGCVIVRDGKIIGRGYNKREQLQDATMHAEIEAIRQACLEKGSWRLDDCTLYVTLEPCPMCAGAILQSRIGCVVFGSRDKQLGAVGGVFDLFYEDLHFTPQIVPGVREEECTRILREFFKKIR